MGEQLRSTWGCCCLNCAATQSHAYDVGETSCLRDRIAVSKSPQIEEMHSNQQPTWQALPQAGNQVHERTTSKQSMPPILMDHPQNMQAILNYLVEKFSFPNFVSRLTFGFVRTGERTIKMSGGNWVICTLLASDSIDTISLVFFYSAALNMNQSNSNQGWKNNQMSPARSGGESLSVPYVLFLKTKVSRIRYSF